jgi:ParB family chromosome partitioning protein
MNTAMAAITDSTTIIATTTTAIPLDKLTAWPGNVRRTGADTGLAELSASIAAHGLLQSLVVRRDRRGKYAVIAGRRRLLALGTKERLAEIEARLDELNDCESAFTPEDIAIAGCVVSIGYDGKHEVHHGYVLPEDAPKKSAKTKTVTRTGEDGAVTVIDNSSLPAALTESLTAQRSAALAACLSENPDIALAAVVHAMALDVFYRGSSHGSCVRMSATCSSLDRVEDSAAFTVLQRAREIWGDKLPGGPDALWTWCLEQHRDTLLDLMAFCAARTVNAVQSKGDRPDCERLLHADRLGDALKLDMTKWFTPTAGNYFGRVTKTAILAALAEVKGAVAPAWEKAKKSELAALAEREIAGTGWLPAVLR